MFSSSFNFKISTQTDFVIYERSISDVLSEFLGTVCRPVLSLATPPPLPRGLLVAVFYSCRAQFANAFPDGQAAVPPRWACSTRPSPSRPVPTRSPPRLQGDCGRGPSGRGGAGRRSRAGVGRGWHPNLLVLLTRRPSGPRPSAPPRPAPTGLSSADRPPQPRPLDPCLSTASRSRFEAPTPLV